MSKNVIKPIPSAVNLGDFIYVIFKHKWKILLLSFLFAGAAAAYYLKAAVPYESGAKLMVRYIVERNSLDRIDSTTASSGRQMDSIIQEEMEIFTSWDLAESVAETLAAPKTASNPSASTESTDAPVKENEAGAPASPKPDDGPGISYSDLIGPGFDGVPSKSAAAGALLRNLTVTAERGSSVIHVTYRDSNPALPRQVLEAFVQLYLSKHLEIHRSKDSQGLADQAKTRANTEVITARGDLKRLLDTHKILSLLDGTDRFKADVSAAQLELNRAAAEWEGQSRKVKELERILASGSGESGPADTSQEASPSPPVASQPVATATVPAAAVPAATEPAAAVPNAAAPVAAAPAATVPDATVPVAAVPAAAVPAAAVPAAAVPAAAVPNAAAPVAAAPAATVPDATVLDSYRALSASLAQARASRDAMLLKLKPESAEARYLQSQIESLVSQRIRMEKDFPQLVMTADTSPHALVPGFRFDLPSEQAELHAMEARVTKLKEYTEAAQKRADAFAKDAQEIAGAQKRLETAEENYKYFVTSSQKAHADSLLKADNIPNISTVQTPTPAMKNISQRNRIMLGMLFGGPVMVVGCVLLFGLFLDRTIKRPVELEDRMNLPLMLSIPWFSRRERLKARCPMGASKATRLLKESESDKAPWDQYHFIHPFAEAMRDRLANYFEATGNVRKPKLIAVTGYSAGAGTSTLAGGLASSLSEIGDGKVLLVDMNGHGGAAHPFFDGRPALSLTRALRLPPSGGKLREPQAGASEKVDNLFLARADAPSPGAATIGLRRMMPELKASDFDYIVFDMPPLGQTKPTATMAGFMDKVIVIVEAEANSRSEVRRGYRDLMDAEADVSLVFNKARRHGPRSLIGSIA